MKTSIMIVEDDQAIRNFMTATLDLNAYQCIAAESGEQALMYAVTNRPDIIILDLGLPDMDGVDIIRKLRTWSQCPIIVVSARSEDKDKISALDAGADDYLTKPFSMDELLARLRVAVRKLSPAQAGEEAVFVNGGLKIDYTAGCVYVEGQECHLTPMEYKLVCLLAKNAGRVLTHKYILKEVWNSTLESDIPSLRVFMATLRKKIDREGKYIQTHIGVGYRMLRITEGE
ncbi:response regulator [Christensenella timonensis]|uniref:response regulator n=1 Tax=Christensenella timonensis TaxID=1816678 RepID=UPI000B2FD0CD|nr:response regulator transcription factor [Christensenella timonensis]